MTAAPPPIGQAPAPGLDTHSVFRSVFAAYPDALLVVDTGGKIVLANTPAAELLGYEVDALVGLPVDVLVPDSVRPRHASLRADYGRAPRARPMGSQMDLVARRRDGSEVMVEIALSPLQEHGLPYVVAAIRGIGSYPRVRQALQRARYSEHVAQFGRLAVDAREIHQLLDEAPRTAADALQVETATLYLLESGGSAFRVVAGVGLVSIERVGERVLNRPDTPPGYVLAQARPVLVPDCAAERRFVVPQAYLDNGCTTALAVPLSDRGRTIGVLTVKSTTPERFGDEETRFLESLASLLATSLQRTQSEEALDHAQRLESVGQLTGGIAHDFNNLLTVISGNLQVLADLPTVAGDALAPQLVDAAARASKRGAELTGKLLAFSRRQVLETAPVDAAALVRSLADMLRRTLDQRIRIEVAQQHPCPPVLADAGQLESALLNIAINARDAMPEGGTLTFTCRVMPPHAAALPAAIREAPDSSYLALSISDTGSGMTPEVRERAFEPFFTTKATGRGTGLGLSTVYGFARQSHGAATIDSAPGAGTTITLWLPSATDAAAQDDDSAHVPDELPDGLCVLLVEDDAEVRHVAERFLESLGCRVTACASAEQGLAELQRDAAIDLLLTDIALGPGMQGTELAGHAREVRPGLPVLLMSGYSSALLEAPAGWDLLRKPYTRAELAQAMARVLPPAQ